LTLSPQRHALAVGGPSAHWSPAADISRAAAVYVGIAW
jgi:hypothetical protein